MKTISALNSVIIFTLLFTSQHMINSLRSSKKIDESAKTTELLETASKTTKLTAKKIKTAKTTELLETTEAAEKPKCWIHPYKGCPTYSENRNCRATLMDNDSWWANNLDLNCEIKDNFRCIINTGKLNSDLRNDIKSIVMHDDCKCMVYLRDERNHWSPRKVSKNSPLDTNGMNIERISFYCSTYFPQSI